MGNVKAESAKRSTPTTRKSKSVGEGYDAEFRGYINLELSPGEKDVYDEWATTAAYWAVLEAQVTDGVNLSLKFDPRKGGYLASGTQRRIGSENAGLVVTARARDAATALGRLLYVLAILGRSPRWEDTQPLADPDRW